MTKVKIKERDEFHSNKRIIQDLWTSVMDMKNHLSRKDQDFFMDEESHVTLTNREAIAILSELFVLRVSVDALQEKAFPGGKESRE